jgi:hypothetical protein
MQGFFLNKCLSFRGKQEAINQKVDSKMQEL